MPDAAADPAATDPAATDIAAVAERLRAHPDVLAGPSVRALLAVAELHAAYGTLTGQPHLSRLLRAALTSLPHRLRVRPGADAEEIVRDAVLAVAAPQRDDVPPARRPVQRPGPGSQEREEARPVFTLAEDATGAPHGGSAGPRGAEPGIDELLAAVLRPARRGPLADGRSPTPGARPPAGERSAPAPLRPGDRTRDVSVRATLRAALRAGVDATAALPPEVLRARPPRPDVALDVVLTLDVSASMLGADVAPLARALVAGLTRAGHRVGLQVFAAGTTQLCELTRDRAALLGAAAAYEPENPTNLELAIFAGHDLLRRTGARSRAGVVLLVTDAEPTVCGTPARRARGFGSGAARAAALAAAAEARADGVTVSVLCPPPGSVARVDLDFGARLALAGGGDARCYPGM